MRRLITALLVAALLVGFTAPAVQAGNTAANVALGLASFAVFNQLVGPFLYPRPAYAYGPVYVTSPPPAVVYAPPVMMAPTPVPTVVQYPHGRYELRVIGGQYHWVWFSNPPPPPAPSYQPPGVPAPPPAAAPPPTESSTAPCKLTGKYVKTPQGMLPECE